MMNVMSLVGLAFSGKRKALRSNRLSTGIDKRDVKANFTIRPDHRARRTHRLDRKITDRSRQRQRAPGNDRLDL